MLSAVADFVVAVVAVADVAVVVAVVAVYPLYILAWKGVAQIETDGVNAVGP